MGEGHFNLNKFQNRLKLMKNEMLIVIGEVKTKSISEMRRLQDCGFEATFSPVEIKRWHAPTPGTMKLNVDISKKHQSTSFAAILRNSEGHMLWAAMGPLPLMGILEAEVRAIKEGCLACLSRGIENFEIETDSQVAAQMIQGIIEIGWKVRTDIDEIRRMLGSRSLSYVPRQHNLVADNLSKWARTCNCEGFFFDVRALPARIRGAIFLDSKGFPIVS